MLPQSLHKELRFQAVRSSGKGGQHVNKVSSAVELYFNVRHSRQLNEDQRNRIEEQLRGRISKEGILMLVSQSERSQIANKKEVLTKFDVLIAKALHRKRKRIATQVSEAKRRQRLDEKRKLSEKKSLRRNRLAPE